MVDHKPDPFSQYIGDDYAHSYSNEEDNCDHGIYMPTSVQSIIKCSSQLAAASINL